MRSYIACVPPGSWLETLRRRLRRQLKAYYSPEEVADHMISEMDEGQKNTWRYVLDKETRKPRPITPDDIHMAHHGSGRVIRNSYGLWEPENPYTKVDAGADASGVISHPMFPDQVSNTIMKLVVAKLMPRPRIVR